MTGTKNFRDEYHESQNEFTLSEQAKASILEAAKNQEANEQRASGTYQSVTPNGVAQPKKPRRYWKQFAVAACTVACAIALVAGLMPTAQTTDSNPFALVAYATSDIPLKTSDKIIAFQDNRAISGGEEYGLFTGCLFDIEGEDIESIDVTLSKGQLCAIAIDKYIKPEYIDPSLPEKEREKLHDIQWQAHDDSFERIKKILGGEIYPASESVRGIDNIVCDTSAVRLLGQSISMPYKDIDKETGIDYSQAKLSFMLTPEDIKADDAIQEYLAQADLNAPLPEWFDYAYNIFHDAILTTTVHFKDGTQTEKSYLLKSGKLKIGDNPNFTLTPPHEGPTEPPYFVLPELASDDEWHTRSLYLVEILSDQKDTDTQSDTKEEIAPTQEGNRNAE